MARTEQGGDRAGAFFLATLLLWLVSILFEILFNRRDELVYVIAGCLFFQAANWIVRRCISRDPLFVNTFVSLLHSSTTSASVVYILASQWMKDGSGTMFEHTRLVGGAWPWAYKALCFSCGYFAYDQWDMLQYRLYGGWIPSILVHHLILLLCFTLALYRNVTINYLILTLVCELHSIFLHSRKIRRMVGIRDAESMIVKVEWVLNWGTFFLARLVPHILITAKIIKDSSKFRSGVELPLALFGMAGMNMLNAGLAIDLFGAFRREISPMNSNRRRD
ncbi:hypothetical protein SAY87_026374 [Trapa incisa]|uniref:TLC domain-containing protein n=1 Tax=Trapa incisa TaxID=236973 RepID=A0AAN7JK47_9MYRT|nr:hypothetical protein SAY87_026374 [Trapa incisa]